MWNEKRGKAVIIVLFLVVFLLAVGTVFAGWCLKTDPPELYCSTGTQDDCCGIGVNCPEYKATEPVECTIVCCYIDGSTVDECNYIYQSTCSAQSGTAATSCDALSDCDIGCCCYKDENNLTHSDIRVRGACISDYGKDFNTTSTISNNDQLCSEYCVGWGAGPGGPGKAECDDNIDNDGDGLMDYGQDPGCSSLGDNSETDSNVQCDNGLDDDGDGLADSLDSCCFDNPTKEEDFCDIDVCIADELVYLTECRCYNKYRCSQNQYCCTDGCFNSPCGASTCLTGEQKSCGIFSGSCELFEHCIDGEWDGNCLPIPTCGLPFEICTDGIDNNDDGYVDCDDITCQDMTCNYDKQTCKDKGYYDVVNNNYVWKCCYSGQVNDCDVDGVNETCGNCNCRQLKLPPDLLSVSIDQGEDFITVEWQMNCDVDIYLYRCMKGEKNCVDYFEFDPNPSTPLDVWVYEDPAIMPETEYCYYVQADYDGDLQNSEIKCVVTGQEACMDMTSKEFCLNETGGTSGKKTLRAWCSDGVVATEACNKNPNDNYICMGPYLPYETVECVYQSDCDECGEPLNMFADFATASAVYIDPGGYSSQLRCQDIPTCYYDYTDTAVDKFSECSNIDSCYGYRSELGCENQYNIDGINNKCLPRDCEWKLLDGNPDLDLGICFDTLEKYKRCEYCNSAENNEIFDLCTLDRCMQFGDCYIRPIDSMCVDASEITCQEFLTKDECAKTNNVDVDVNYDGGRFRVVGSYDNSIITPSDDMLGIGLCKWDPNYYGVGDGFCYKDADDDDMPDVFPYDKTPPNSRVITPKKVQAMNITLEVSDLNPGGSQGTGVKFTYICLDDSAYCYPTDRLVPENNIVNQEFGVGNGQHTIYFYSEDKARNLEVVKSVVIDIDRTPPVINIEAFLTYDFINYQNSNVTFKVSTNENARCIDNFEGSAGPQINNEYGSMFLASYYGLTDGTYTYKVNCTDDVGNSEGEYYDLIINIDSSVFNPSPSGVIDYTPAVLSVNTQKNILCTYGVDDDPFNNPIEDNGSWYHSVDYDLTNSGTYSFDVKCQLGDRVSYDEIQFVYDVETPVTKVLDMYRQDFDFTKWYTGVKDKIFLDCFDEPENGFGCKSTFYCVGDSICTPSTLNNPYNPIEYTLSGTTETWLCYYSIENTIGNYGGLVEETVCKEITIDYIDPILKIYDIESFNTVDNYFTTLSDNYVISGSVDDPDTDYDPDNLVTIIVTNESGMDTVYSDIPANTEFSQMISLSLGLNEILVYATDRSGASGDSSFKTVFIYVAEYDGPWITLVKPNIYGVARTRVTDFTVESYKDAECRWAIDDRFTFESSYPMEKELEPDGAEYNYYHTGFDFDLGELSEVKNPVFIKCKDSRGIIFEAEFNLSWDDSKPEIENIWLSNSDAKDPPTVVEYPMETDILVETDDEVRCKYVEIDGNAHDYNTGMIKFDGYDDQLPMLVNKQFFGPDLVNPSQTSYYFQCENGAGIQSDKVEFTLYVNTAAATGFTFLSPEKKTKGPDIQFKIRTSKTTFDCMYGPDEPPTELMTGIDEKTHESPVISLAEGEYKYYFKCKVATGSIEDYYKFTVDNSPPTVPVIDDGNRSWYLTKLSAKWDSEDDLSGVDSYNYSIGSSPGAADILDWKETSKKKITEKDLNLTNGSTYYWSVIAGNDVGLWSGIGHSDGVYVDTSKYEGEIPLPNETLPLPFNKCFNGVKDGNETDIDCGGNVCDPCTEPGDACLVNSDCSSNYCVDGVCIAATCSDGVRNQDESAVDCGGVCDPCGLGVECYYDSDCESLYCDSTGICAEPSCSDGIRNGDEEGVDCGGSCPYECTAGRTDCMVNGELDTDCDGIPDSWETKYGLDKYDSDDAFEDMDEDGYSNYEEYKNGTDPTEPDKSGWGFWTWFLIILCLIIILAGGSYVGYVEYEKKKKVSKLGSPYGKLAAQGLPPPKGRVSVSGHPGKMPPKKPKTPEEKYLESLSSMIRSKRQAAKQKDRKSVMSKFDDDKTSDDEHLKPRKPKKALDKIISASEERKKIESMAPKPIIKKPEEVQIGTGAKKPPIKSVKKIPQAKSIKKPIDDKALKELSKMTKKVKGKDALKELSKIARPKKTQAKPKTKPIPKKKVTKKPTTKKKIQKKKKK